MSGHTPAPPPNSKGSEAAKAPAPAPPAGSKPSAETATSATEPTTSSSSNPRVKSHQGSNINGGGGELVVPVSSAQVTAVPRGGAVSAAQQLRNNPSGMHDVEFYQSIAQELPDSKVIHSILYTHRSVMDDGLTVDEEVANIKTSSHEWGSNKSTQVKEIQAMKKTHLVEALEQEKVDEEQKVLEHTRVFARCEEIATDLDTSIEATLVAEDEELKKQRLAMEMNMKKRKLALDQRLKDQDEEDLKTRVQHANLEALAGLARTEMEELMKRGLTKTTEEKARIGIAFQAADEAQCLGVLAESVELKGKLSLVEQRERSDLQTWIDDTNTRARRQHRLAELRGAMTSNVCLSEQGERQNLTSQAAVELMTLEEQYTTWQNRHRVGASPKRKPKGNDSREPRAVIVDDASGDGTHHQLDNTRTSHQLDNTKSLLGGPDEELDQQPPPQPVDSLRGEDPRVRMELSTMSTPGLDPTHSPATHSPATHSPSTEPLDMRETA